MSEKEWIEYIIYERMELHWQELYHSKADGRQEESQMLDRVEAILKRLTKKERKTINRFEGVNFFVSLKLEVPFSWN